MRNSSSSLAAVLTGRTLLLALATAAVAVAFVEVRAPALRPPAGVHSPASYVCPMHPDVVAVSPGDCPICGMALEPRKRDGEHAAAAAGAPPASVVLPPAAAIATFEELGWGKRHEMARELRAPGWAESAGVIQALFYRDEIALLGTTEEALFFPSTHLKDGTAPGVSARRIDEPSAPWDDSTALIRLRLEGKSTIAVGQTGWIKFATRVRNMLAVRAPAVIPSPEGPYVLLVGDDMRTLTKRPIKIGSVLYEHAAVLSGLDVGERVAVLNTFFLDAERRFTVGGTP